MDAPHARIATSERKPESHERRGGRFAANARMAGVVMRATRARRALLGGIALLSVLAVAAPARADSVTDWDQIAAAALQSPGTATPPGAGQGAPSIVHLAMVHAAVYDAVNAIDGGHEPYVSSPAAEPFYSQDAAVAAAARHVLVNGGLGIPAARLVTIKAAYQNAIDAIAPGPAKDGGIATGEAAAAALLAARAGDGRFGPFLFTVGDAARRMAADQAASTTPSPG